MTDYTPDQRRTTRACRCLQGKVYTDDRSKNESIMIDGMKTEVCVSCKVEDIKMRFLRKRGLLLTD